MISFLPGTWHWHSCTPPFTVTSTLIMNTLGQSNALFAFAFAFAQHLWLSYS